jgi:hypothetical protein
MMDSVYLPPDSEHLDYVRSSNSEAAFQFFIVESISRFTLDHFHFWKQVLTNKAASIRLVVCRTWSLSIESLPPGKQSLQKPRVRTFRNECHCK